MSSSNKTPNLNLNLWQNNDKFCMADFNNDNQTIDTGFGKLEDNLKTHIENFQVHIDQDTSNSIKSHIANSKIHIDEEKVIQISSQIEEHINDEKSHLSQDHLKKISSLFDSHTKDKTLHTTPAKLEKIKTSLSDHCADKNIHVDPADTAAFKSHIKDPKIHCNEAIIKNFNDHISNSELHINPNSSANPFYVVGSFMGNGNDSQLINLPFTPSFVIVFAGNSPCVKFSSNTQDAILYFGFCSKDAPSAGLWPAPNGFTAKNIKASPVCKVVKNLNFRGITYHYVAFR